MYRLRCWSQFVDPSASSFEGTMKRNTLFWLKVERIYDWIRGSSKSVKSHSFRLMVWIVMFVCGTFFTFCFLFLFTALWPNERRHGQWSSVQPKRPKAEDIPSHPHDSSVGFSFIFVFDLYGGDTIDNNGLFNRVGLIEWIQNTKPFKDVLLDAMTQTELDNYRGK